MRKVSKGNEVRMIPEVETKVYQFLLDYCHKRDLRKGILVANSGGPDSTALLIALYNVSKRLDFRLFSAYVDHGLREFGETREEAAFIEALCKERDIPFFKETIPPGKIEDEGRKHRKGIEAQARMFRYQLLQEISEMVKASYIAMGHTLDDQLETLIMRVFQGSGVKGLAGIPAVRENIIRPLLGLEKESLLEYLKSKEVPFKEDSTNSSLRYRRNKVRHELIPMIKTIFPGLGSSLAVFQERMEYLVDMVNENLNGKLSWVPNKTDTEGGSSPNSRAEYSISLTGFNKAHRFCREESLYRICDSLLKTPDLRIPYRFIREMIDLLEKEENEEVENENEQRKRYSLGKPLCQGHGVALHVRDKKAFITREDPLAPSVERFWPSGYPLADKKSSKMEEPRQWKGAEGFENRKKKGYVIVLERGKSYIIDTLGKIIITYGSSGKKKNQREHGKDPGTMLELSGAKILPPLIIRNRLPGDHLILGSRRRSIAKILKNWKVPNSIRESIPIIEDRKGIIGIWGAPFGYTNKTAKRIESDKTAGNRKDLLVLECVSPKIGNGYGEE